MGDVNEDESVVEGLLNANNQSFALETSGSSSIELKVSEGVTGGVFIYSTRELLYSMFDGDNPEPVIDRTTQGTRIFYQLTLLN